MEYLLKKDKNASAEIRQKAEKIREVLKDETALADIKEIWDNYSPFLRATKIFERNTSNLETYVKVLKVWSNMLLKFLLI